MSEGSAIAIAVLLGTGGATDKKNVTLTMYDIGSGLLWKYDHEVRGSLGSSPDKLKNSLMKNSSKKFPYNKSKK